MLQAIEPNPNAIAENDQGYGQILSILLRRKFWFFGTLGTVLLAAFFITLKTKPSYRSTLQLLVEPNYEVKNRDANQAAKDFTDSNVQIDYATQLNVMRSPQLLAQAAALLKPKYPSITVGEIKKNLVLKQVVEDDVNTKLFQADLTSDDPVKTQDILQAVQQVYLNYNRDQQQQRLAKGLAFIDSQLPAVRKSLVQAEAALEQFRKKENLVEPELQAKLLNDSLSQIDQERRNIRAQYREYQARYLALQSQVGSSTQDALTASRLSQSTRYQSLLNEIQKTELAIEQQRSRFTDSSPAVQLLLEQRQKQLSLLQTEEARVLGNAQTGSTGADLLSAGQLGGLDLKLTEQLVDAQTMLRGLQERDRSLAQRELQVREQLSRFPSLLAEYGRLQPEVKIKRDTLEQLLKARQDLALEIARGGFDWQVVEQPQLGLKVGPSLPQNLLLGLAAGLVLGGAAAFMREMVDDAVHSSDELKKQVALPLLGMTPKLPQAKVNEPILNLPLGMAEAAAPWTIQVVPGPSAWESLDLIYKNIQLLNSLSAFKSLMITSALAGEGKSTVALGLAVSAARLHQRVLLIDADLRSPSLHQQLNLPNEHGLSNLLSSNASLPSQSSIQSSIQSSGSYIDILTSGPVPSDPANLLSSPRMGELMAAFEQSYDLVVIDAPPVLGRVDAMLAGSFCSGVVLVAGIGKVTRTELTDATTMLNRLNVIGVVANEFNAGTNGFIPYGKQEEIALAKSA